MKGVSQPAKKDRKSNVEECIFDYMASHIECRFNKNSLLQCYFLAILPAGIASLSFSREFQFLLESPNLILAQIIKMGELTKFSKINFRENKFFFSSENFLFALNLFSAFKLSVDTVCHRLLIAFFNDQERSLAKIVFSTWKIFSKKITSYKNEFPFNLLSARPLFKNSRFHWYKFQLWKCDYWRLANFSIPFCSKMLFLKIQGHFSWFCLWKAMAPANRSCLENCCFNLLCLYWHF